MFKSVYTLTFITILIYRYTDVEERIKHNEKDDIDGVTNADKLKALYDTIIVITCVLVLFRISDYIMYFKLKNWCQDKDNFISVNA